MFFFVSDVPKNGENLKYDKKEKEKKKRNQIFRQKKHK